MFGAGSVGINIGISGAARRAAIVRSGTEPEGITFAQVSVLGLEDQWAINPTIQSGTVGEAFTFGESLNMVW